ncbi:lipopolysaccharide biosynthesis protein [Lacinutrix salivirga]
MSRKKKLFSGLNFAYKNVGSLLIVKASGIVINYIALLLILRFFGAYGNGEIANFVAQSKALMIFFVFGLDIILVKKLNDNNKSMQSFVDIGKTLLLNFVLGLLIFIVINQFASIGYSFLVGGILFALWRFTSHFYRGRNKMIAYGFFEFVLFQTTVLISIVLTQYFNFNFINSILYVNVVFAVVFFSYFFIKNNVIFKANLFLKVESLKKIYLEAYHFLLSNSIIIISTSVLYYIIKTNYSTETLGFYDGVLKFSLVIALPLIATNGRVMYMTSKLFNNNAIDDLRKYIGKITKMLVIMSTFAALFVTIVFIIYSKYFNVDFQSYWVLFALLVCAQLVNNWSGPVGIVLQLTNNEKIYNALTLITSLYLVLSTLIIAKTLSINFVALNYLVYMLFQNVASLLIVKKKLGINPYKL